MRGSERYVMLMSSLPPHRPKWFAARETPLSRLQLDARLRLLDPGDARNSAGIEDLMHWERMSMEVSDAAVLELGTRTLARLESEFIKEILGWRLELRTAVAALRRRKLGLPAPSPGSPWGFGRWVRWIERHWEQPAFALEHVFPWLAEAEKVLRGDQHLALERLLLGLVWDYYGRMAAGHYFDFDAVVIYVLRWDVIDRWSRYHAEAATARFDGMVDRALADMTPLFAD